jgi:hypothetical protein
MGSDAAFAWRSFVRTVSGLLGASAERSKSTPARARRAARRLCRETDVRRSALVSGFGCILWPIASSEPDPEAFRLAYEEAKRGLDDQEQAVVELRSRAGTLIAAAAITTSFFGSQAVRNHVHVMGWIAIGCFVALGASGS